MTKIKFIIIFIIMASIPLSILAIDFNTLTVLLTNFNNTKALLETAKILSQLKFDNNTKKAVEQFKLNNKKRYEQEIMTFSRNEKKLTDAYNLIQAYYYIYGRDYWYKIMLNRITNKLVIDKVNDNLLKSVFINENFDLLMNSLDYISKKMYDYNEVITSLLPMYKWKIQSIYTSMENALKKENYDDFIKNYKLLKSLNKYKNIKKAIGFDYTLPNLENINFKNLTPETVEIFKYFPKLFKDVYDKNIAKAKESFQSGRYSDAINILNMLSEITSKATNLISENQKDDLQKMLIKSKAVKNFILGISNLYLQIQRANSWSDFKNILDSIYTDFDTSYIVYFDHAFINGKLIIIFRDYKKSLSDYMKIKKDNGENIVQNMTSLYNESQLIISKIKYNDILKDKFTDLSKYLKQFIEKNNQEKSKKEKILFSSISISITIAILIILWVFSPPTSKANFFMMIGMKKTALSIMQKHITKEAGNPQFHLTLGEIYEKLGRQNEAEYHYKIAMEYFKENKKYKKGD